jgi:alkyldihydroxyacetonephosphate synthase
MTLEIDRQSLLVGVPGAATLGAVEAALASSGLTLGGALPAELPVGDWLAQGAPGAPSVFADPADHVLAGLEATLVSGQRFIVHPAPRRAVGPDLTALVVGAGERFATVDYVWLRVRVKGARQPSLPLPTADLDPPVSPEEEAVLEAIGRELRRMEP